jgi:pimeloyl-ACP methyl ester carboxylesterase
MPKAIVNGTELHYHVTGRGVPIVFIHPPLITASTFNYQRAELSQYFKVITFDIRGHGLSAPSDQPVTYELIAEDMKQLLDDLQVDEAYLCGYSQGATVALHAMLHYPQRYSGGILLSGMSEVSDWRLKLMLGGASSALRMGLGRLLARGISWGNKDSADTYKQLLSYALQGYPRNMREYFDYSLSYNCTRELPRIKLPILLVYGQKDRSFYRYAEMLHHGLPKSSLYFMRGVGHQLPTKAGDRVNELMRQWLKQQIEARAEAGERAEDQEEMSRTLEQLAAYEDAWKDQEMIHRNHEI